MNGPDQNAYNPNQIQRLFVHPTYQTACQLAFYQYNGLSVARMKHLDKIRE